MKHKVQNELTTHFSEHNPIPGFEFNGVIQKYYDLNTPTSIEWNHILGEKTLEGMMLVVAIYIGNMDDYRKFEAKILGVE